MSAVPSSDSLSRTERVGLWVFLVVVVLFGMLTEWRAVFMNTRKGDQEIYFQTAYAVRTGKNIYQVEDGHGWHYIYPPLFAILTTPLAEKPPKEPIEVWTLPFSVSVALWYAVSLAVLGLGVHSMASALEHASGTEVRPGGRRWWALRMLPVLVCLPAIGHTLMRGQVNLLLLAMIAGMIAGILRNQPWRAGVYLGTAVCLKLIPAFLVIYPLWRRDFRVLAGSVLGLILSGVVLPVAVFGPHRTVVCYRDFAVKIILPGLGQGEDKSRAGELMEMTATHSQSFIAAIHSTIHLGNRPPEAAPAVRLSHWLIAGLLTCATLWAAGWRKPSSPADTLVFLGCLTLLMILSSPVCHTHYFALAVPLVMGVLAVRWEKGGRLGSGWLWVLALFTLVFATLPLRRMEGVRNLAVGLYPALAILAGSLRLLYLRRTQTGQWSVIRGQGMIDAESPLAA